jgi:translation initiation factor 2B subunit (eIF-2B alpha/beta/delta family)
LALTFHHATFGQHFHFSPEIRAWAFDRVTGASELTRRLLSTINPKVDDPKHVAMLRPTMVAIVNALKSLETSSPEEVATRLAHDTQATVSTGIQAIRDLIQQRQDPLSPLQVATLSRSSTIRDVLKPLLAENLVVVVVSQSTPGNEGEAMAAELGVEWKDDATLMDDISNYDLLLFGADCVMSNGYVVNKVGTQALAKAAKASGTQVWCCTDPWKRWQDEFPPPMEDIFELVSNQCIDRIVMGSSDRLL